MHLAIFDDSYYESFHRHLDRRGETTWHTNLDRAYDSTHGSAADSRVLAPFEAMLKRAAAKMLRKKPELLRTRDDSGAPIHGAKQRLRRLVDGEGRLVLPPGGLQDMAHYNFVLVRGGAWKEGDERW